MKLIGKHPTGLCEGCQVEETVEHFRMNCSGYGMERGTYEKSIERIGYAGVYFGKYFKISEEELHKSIVWLFERNRVI
jgi:hypothetical protein